MRKFEYHSSQQSYAKYWTCLKNILSNYKNECVLIIAWWILLERRNKNANLSMSINKSFDNEFRIKIEIGMDDELCIIIVQFGE